jgi:hypothetical protein
MLLLFGIPVYVWLKWRQAKTAPLPEADLDAAVLRRAYTPPPKPRVPAGVNGK